MLRRGGRPSSAQQPVAAGGGAGSDPAAADPLYDECINTLFPSQPLALKLRDSPATLRRVLQHFCGQPVSLAADARVPPAPIWIAAVMHGSDKMATVKESLQAAGSSMCGKTLRARDVVFRCLDCASDPTCVMCQECFQRSPCRNHKYRMSHAGGGMCDCGDPTAWKSEGFCSLHSGGNSDDPLAKVPPALVAWVTECLQAAVRFTIRAAYTAVIEASKEELMAGEESLVKAALRAVTMLSEFAQISDAARRLVAQAFAGSAELSDVPDVPKPPEGAFGLKDAKNSSSDDDDIDGGEEFQSDNESTQSEDEDDDQQHQQRQQQKRRQRQAEQHADPSTFAGDIASFRGVSQEADDDVDGDASGDDAAEAKKRVEKAKHRFTLFDQLFLVDMAQMPKSANQLMKDISELLTGISIDTAFRRQYLLSFAATAWHYAIGQKAEGKLLRSKRTFRKDGRLYSLAVQVLTVGPMVNEALTPDMPNAPTILSALLGAQLIILAKQGRRVASAGGMNLHVYKRNIRRHVPFSSLHHLRYSTFTSNAAKVLLATRHLFRALVVLEQARQGSEYTIERSTDRKNLDTDMWDCDALHAPTLWTLHDTLKAAVQQLVATAGSASEPKTTIDALGVPPEQCRADASLRPPTDLPVEGIYKLVIRCNATPDLPDRPTSLADSDLPKWVAALRRCFGTLFEDMGEALSDLALRPAYRRALQTEVVCDVNTAPGLSDVTHGGGGGDDEDAFVLVRHENRERRVAIHRYSLLTAGTPFTFHTPLNRFTALMLRAVVEGCLARLSDLPSADAALTEGAQLLRVLVVECLGGPSEAAQESEITVPALLDTAAAPQIQISQYVDQLWRTDYCGVHKHSNIYYSFQPSHFHQLDLFVVQLLAATYGGNYVTFQLLLRYGYSSNASDEESSGIISRMKQKLVTAKDTVPTGHWHFLRHILAVATDDSKTNLASVFKTRIIHALARHQLRRSDLDRVIHSFESEDTSDQKTLARSKAIDTVLKEVANVEKRKDGNRYMLKPEAWVKVNAYHATWTPFDVENSIEQHELQTRQHYAKAAQEQGKANAKPPRRPAVITTPEHAPVFARLTECLHTVSTLSVCLEPLLLRASKGSSKDAKKSGSGLPQATGPHMLTAIDALYAAMATARGWHGCSPKDPNARGVRWAVYERRVQRLRETAAWSPNFTAKHARLLPVDTSGTDGMLHKALLHTTYKHVTLGGNSRALPAPMTGHEALRKLIDDADNLLDDVPAHSIGLLQTIVADLEATIPDEDDDVAEATSSSATAGDGVAAGQGHAAMVDPEEAAAKKKKALKDRQAALMARLRKKQATSIAAAEETIKSNMEAGGRDASGAPLSGTANTATGAEDEGMDTVATGSSEAGSTAFHLADCTSAFETMECICAFCNEGSSPQRPLAFLGQTACSDSLIVLADQLPTTTPSSSSDAATSGQATSHINFCGHMAHQECFARRVTHLSALRERGREQTDLQAFLRGLHFKGMRYLTKNESLCPVCSRAVSAMCPSASARPNGRDPITAAFVTSLARCVVRKQIGSELKLEDLAEFAASALDTSIHDADGGAEVEAVVNGVPDLQGKLEALAAAQAAAQQLSIEAVSSSAGRATTLRSFSALHAMVNAVCAAVRSHLNLADNKRDRNLLLKLVRNAVRRDAAAHGLALATMLAGRLSSVVPELNDLAVEAARNAQLTLATGYDEADAVLRLRNNIRVGAIVRMTTTHVPLPPQQTTLAEASSLDEIVNRLSFACVDAGTSSSSSNAREVATLRMLASYAVGDAASAQAAAVNLESGNYPRGADEDSPPGAAYLDATLAARLVERVPVSFLRIVEDCGGAACAVCTKADTPKVLCLNSGEKLCARGDPPELRGHALAHGRGTALFVEATSTRVHVVQAVNGRAASLAPLHVDEYGEPDVGLTRGMPLTLSRERASEVTLSWLRCSWDHLTQVLHSDTWSIVDRPI